MAKKEKNQKKAKASSIKEEKGPVPSTFVNQNLGHNSKKEGLGPNTKRD